MSIHGDISREILCNYKINMKLKYEESFTRRYYETQDAMLEFIIVNSKGITQLVYRAGFHNGKLLNSAFDNKRSIFLMDS